MIQLSSDHSVLHKKYTDSPADQGCSKEIETKAKFTHERKQAIIPEPRSTLTHLTRLFIIENLTHIRSTNINLFDSK